MPRRQRSVFTLAVAVTTTIAVVGAVAAVLVLVRKPTPEECRQDQATSVVQEEPDSVEVRWSWSRLEWICVEIFDL